MTGPETHATASTTGETAVLDTLADGRWRTSAEIVDDTGLLPLTVRSMLRDLCGRELVRRTIDGRWQLTAAGTVHAARLHAGARRG